MIGGGPGGMEAARTAAQRGHEVVLFEKDSELGGALIMASALPFKEDMKKYLAWARRMTLNTPNIDIRLSTEATAEAIVKEHPDVLIVAVGSSPTVPPVPGIDGKNVVWAGDVDMGRRRGEDSSGCRCRSRRVAKQRSILLIPAKRVTIIDALPMDQIARDIHPLNLMVLLDMLERPSCGHKTETKLEAVTDSRCPRQRQRTASKMRYFATPVVLSVGFTPRSDLVRRFENLVPKCMLLAIAEESKGILACHYGWI